MPLPYPWLRARILPKLTPLGKRKFYENEAQHSQRIHSFSTDKKFGVKTKNLLHFEFQFRPSVREIY